MNIWPMVQLPNCVQCKEAPAKKIKLFIKILVIYLISKYISKM